jgi:glycosyltransferase A (GT-A) superfamily protein (DUF2064 family)
MSCVRGTATDDGVTNLGIRAFSTRLFAVLPIGSRRTCLLATFAHIARVAEAKKVAIIY